MYLAQLRPLKLTEHTETDIGKLRQILAEVRQQGYAVVVDSWIMASPRWRCDQGSDGRVVAAINSSGYSAS